MYNGTQNFILILFRHRFWPEVVGKSERSDGGDQLNRSLAKPRRAASR